MHQTQDTPSLKSFPTSPPLLSNLRLGRIDLELTGRPVRSEQLDLALQTDAKYSLDWPGAKATLTIEHYGEAVRLQLRLKAEQRLEHLVVRFALTSLINRVYCNGFSDWTGSRDYDIDEQPGRLRWPARLLLRPISDIPIIEKRLLTGKGSKHSHELTVLFGGSRALFVGSLSDHEAFTFFEFGRNNLIVHRDIQGWTINGEATVLDLWFDESNQENVDALYRRFFEQKALPTLRLRPATGYTSWYYHYNRLTPDDLHAVIDRFAESKTPPGIIQIDDGFQTRVGDWLHLKPAFASGLRPVVDRIHAAGFKAGLWLAPFVAEERSQLMQEHPDWIARDERGRPIKAGFNPLWSYWFYALDLRNEAVRRYLRQVFRVVLNEWNFDLLKLDFLYAAALQQPRNKSRAQMMSDGVQLIHEATGWKAGVPFTADKASGPMLLGCGIPLSAAEGRFDYCRIGSDVKESWEDGLLKAVRYQERVSTFNSLISTISRHPYNGRAFWNDPDVFYVRHTFRALKESETSMPLPMTEPEKATLLLLNHALGGLVFTSDPVHRYTEAEQELFSRCFPQIGRRVDSMQDDHRLYTIRFSCEMIDRPLQYLLLANLRDEEATIDLPEGLWFRSCIHADDVTEIPDASWLFAGQIRLKPHHSLCLLQTGELVGTTGHIFPAGDLLSINLNEEKNGGRFLERRDGAMAKQGYLVVDGSCNLAESDAVVRRFEGYGRTFAVIGY